MFLGPLLLFYFCSAWKEEWWRTVQRSVLASLLAAGTVCISPSTQTGRRSQISLNSEHGLKGGEEWGLPLLLCPVGLK